MAIPLPYYLFMHLCNLPFIQLSIGNLAIIADPFPILLSIRDLTAMVDLFPVLSVRDSILSTYLFLLLLGLRSLAVSLHLLMLRDLTMGLHLPTISLLPLIIGGHLLIMLLLS